MPTVHVRSVVPPGGTDQVDEALVAISRGVSAALDGEPSGTWCTFTAVDRSSIGERIVREEDRIVFVDMWIRPRGTDVDRAAFEAACRAAAAGFGVPIEDVWATLHHVVPGRVFAGGALVKDD
jgi:hypothetical protein